MALFFFALHSPPAQSQSSKILCMCVVLAYTLYIFHFRVLLVVKLYQLQFFKYSYQYSIFVPLIYPFFCPKKEANNVFSIFAILTDWFMPKEEETFCPYTDSCCILMYFDLFLKFLRKSTLGIDYILYIGSDRQKRKDYFVVYCALFHPLRHSTHSSSSFLGAIFHVQSKLLFNRFFIRGYQFFDTIYSFFF